MNSLEEFSAGSIGNGADMPKVGNFTSVISKSGGNAYHGGTYFDFENNKMESTNIDDRQLALGVAEAAAQVVAEGVMGIDVEGLLQGALGFLGPVHLVQELRLAAPDLRIAGVLRADLLHGPQGGLVLAVGVLLERLVDLDIDGLTAPLELLAAAARAGPVGIERHRGSRVNPGPKSREG